MSAWGKAREIRAFARAIQRKRAPIEPGSGRAEWLQWAEAYANRIDPLRAEE